MWPDYNWLGIDKELISFIEDYVSKIFQKKNTVYRLTMSVTVKVYYKEGENIG